MKKISLTACALAVLAATSPLAIASSVDLAVIGTITPSACTPSLGGGGTIDYGPITPDVLSETAYTALPIMSVPINIKCDVPSKVAINASNGRPNTVAGALEGTIGFAISPVDLMGEAANNVRVAGLGMSGDEKVGGFMANLVIASVLADGAAVRTIQSNGRLGTWVAASDVRMGGPSLFHFTSPRYISWAATGSLDPIAFTTLTATLNFQAYLNKLSGMTIDKPVKLDGMTTIELVYL